MKKVFLLYQATELRHVLQEMYPQHFEYGQLYNGKIHKGAYEVNLRLMRIILISKNHIQANLVSEKQKSLPRPQGVAG